MGQHRVLLDPLQRAHCARSGLRLGLVALQYSDQLRRVPHIQQSVDSGPTLPDCSSLADHRCLGARLLLGLQERQTSVPPKHVEDYQLAESGRETRRC